MISPAILISDKSWDPVSKFNMSHNRGSGGGLSQQAQRGQ
jgi:hypothetical protein